MDYVKDGIYEMDWAAGTEDVVGGRAVEGYDS
jgi:hypothetical protein